MTFAEFIDGCTSKGMVCTTVFTFHQPGNYLLWWNSGTGEISIIENKAEHLRDPANHMIGEFDSFEYAYTSYLLFN